MSNDVPARKSAVNCCFTTYLSCISLHGLIGTCSVFE